MFVCYESSAGKTSNWNKQFLIPLTVILSL
jgi:hypothetical protein